MFSLKTITANFNGESIDLRQLTRAKIKELGKMPVGTEEQQEAYEVKLLSESCFRGGMPVFNSNEDIDQLTQEAYNWLMGELMDLNCLREKKVS